MTRSMWSMCGVASLLESPGSRDVAIRSGRPERHRYGLSCRGTTSSNPSPSSGESCELNFASPAPARGQTRRGHTATQGSTRMDPLACRRLGLTQVEVTQLGFGGAGLGDLFEVIPEAQAAATLEAAWDAGIR